MNSQDFAQELGRTSVQMTNTGGEHESSATECMDLKPEYQVSTAAAGEHLLADGLQTCAPS